MPGNINNIWLYNKQKYIFIQLDWGRRMVAWPRLNMCRNRKGQKSPHELFQLLLNIKWHWSGCIYREVKKSEMMKQQNSEPRAEQLNEFPKLKSFLNESLKFYQKQDTGGQKKKKMRLHNSKIYIHISYLIFNNYTVNIQKSISFL